MGRKPIGDVPLTASERQERWRRKAQEVTCWDYECVEHHNSAKILNVYGQDGWELVGVDGGIAFFKRRII